jgi:hypothetical protein
MQHYMYNDTVNTPIERQLRKYEIDEDTAVAFIGAENVSIPWDLAFIQDEAWLLLTLIELCRTLLLFNLKVEETALSKEYSPGLPNFVCDQDTHGEYSVTLTLTRMLGEDIDDPEKTGWDADALKGWLKDDKTIAQMPVLAIHSISEHLQVDTVSILESYYSKLNPMRLVKNNSISYP